MCNCMASTNCFNTTLRGFQKPLETPSLHPRLPRKLFRINSNYTLPYGTNQNWQIAYLILKPIIMQQHVLSKSLASTGKIHKVSLYLLLCLLLYSIQLQLYTMLAPCTLFLQLCRFITACIDWLFPTAKQVIRQHSNK